MNTLNHGNASATPNAKGCHHVNTRGKDHTNRAFGVPELHGMRLRQILSSDALEPKVDIFAPAFKPAGASAFNAESILHDRLALRKRRKT